MNNIIYTAAWVLPIESPPISDGAIAIIGDRIQAVGSSKELLNSYQTVQTKVVNLGEVAIMPGMVNLHTHLELTVMRNFLENLSFPDWIKVLTLARQKMSIDGLKVSALWGAAEAIRAGITTVADTGYSGATLAGMTEVGLEGIYFQEVFGPDPLQVNASLKELQANVADHKRYLSGLNCKIEVGVSPHAVYTVSAELFQAVAKFALTENLPVAIHAAESKEETAFIRKGMGMFADRWRTRQLTVNSHQISVMEFLKRNKVLDTAPLLIHAVEVDEKDLTTIQTYGARVAHCPKSNAKFGHGHAPLTKMLEANIKVGFGTDSVASNNICDLIDEARVGLFINQAMEGMLPCLDAAKILRMLTLEGALALHQENEIGSLRAGKRANFIAINLQNLRLLPRYDIEAALCYCATGQDVSLTVVAGKEIFVNGRLINIDESEVAKIVTQIAYQLIP